MEQVTAAGMEKPPVELLIERIRMIQDEMAREKNPYEEAFEDEAEAYLNLDEDEDPKPQKRKCADSDDARRFLHRKHAEKKDKKETEE